MTGAAKSLRRFKSLLTVDEDFKEHTKDHLCNASAMLGGHPMARLQAKQAALQQQVQLTQP